MLAKAIDAVSRALATLAQATLVILVCAMLYEVAARYLFRAPTIWAFDVSYMTAGAIFVLGAAYVTSIDAHIRVDFLAQLLPARVQALITGVAYLFVAAPVFGGLAFAGMRRAMRAYERGEVDTVSVWAPLMWPYLSIIALGLTMLSLQIALQGVRHLLQVRAGTR